MGLVLADSDVLIDYLNNQTHVISALLRRISSGELRIASVSYFEVLCGLLTASTTQSFLDLLGNVPVLPLDRHSAGEAAVIDRALRSGGVRLDARDTLIAGTAIGHNLPLLTRNRRHFERIPGLVIEAL